MAFNNPVTQALNTASSNASDSILKVKTSARDLVKKAVSPEDAALVQNTDVYATEGFAKHPTVKQDEQVPVNADFYRYGKIAADGSNNFEVLPKQIEDFGDPTNESDKHEEASIRMIGKVKKSKKETDLIPAFTKFILQSVQEAHVERSQVVETFGDWYVFFFGERPPVYNYSGTFINAKNINWLGDFMFYYENYLRGTKCVENNARIILTYGGRQVEGFILNTSNTTVSENDKGVSMSFQVLVVDRRVLQLSTDFNLIDFVKNFQNQQDFLSLLTSKGLSAPSISAAFNKVKGVVGGTANAADSQPKTASDIPSIEGEFNSLKGKVTASVTGAAKLKLGL